MKRDYPYKEFRDLILEQLQDIQELDTETAVEDLVRLAESNGLSLADLIEMAQSGMSGADIYRAIHRA